MTRLVSLAPAGQLAPLLTAYSQAAAAKRRQLVLGLALGAIALAVSAVGAEVRPVTLWNKIGNFTSYFDRLLKLDSGMRVWPDPQEWFWGLARWSRLLGETALIAYIATLTSAIAAFICAAPASRNLMRYAPVRFTVYLGALGQTLAIAFLGTLLAAILGIPFGFLAARNVVANRLIHFLSRRSLDTLRSVDTLIWALIWINVVGLGPFAGALAIMSSD